jgi:arylsulfatase
MQPGPPAGGHIGCSFEGQTWPRKHPDILVIFGDDIGMWNVGAYTHAMAATEPGP